MLISLAWLRSLCPLEADADEVARVLTARGLTVDAVQPLGDDVALELDVPANRPDCLGHRGVARELSAALGLPALEDSTPPDPGPRACGELVSVQIDDPRGCPRYAARVVRGVRVAPSPPWVVRRLETCGLRSVNNVVDASNLVLLELGNPIHFFDLSLVPEGRIVVRFARRGERLMTLDGEPRELLDDDLVIADRERPIALAGVMGGADTEIGQETTDVLIEAAAFRPATIRATARRLGLRTEASHRFERGVDPGAVPAAQALAVRWLSELAGGTPVPGMVDVHPGAAARPRVRVREQRIHRLLGYLPSGDEIRAALEPLGLSPRFDESEGCWEVEVPSWRMDLEREADLVEEVGRHLGYDRIPQSAHSGTALRVEPSRAALAVEEQARDAAAALGFNEAFCYAMIGDGEDDAFVENGVPAGIALSNPIAEPMSHLRRSLVPGLLQAASRNLRRGAADVRLFEVGRVFVERGAGRLPSEPLRLGLVWCGAREPAHWSRPARAVGLPEVAGAAEFVLTALRPALATSPAAGGPAGVHPGQSLRWAAAGGQRLGYCGAVHPRVRAVYDLPAGVFVAELDLDPLIDAPSAAPQHTPLPRFPAAQRDLSLVVPEHVSFAEIRTALETVAPPAPVEWEVIDRYVGKPLAAGESSITVRVVLSPTERTLTDDEIESYRAGLAGVLEQRLGIRLRT